MRSCFNAKTREKILKAHWEEDGKIHSHDPSFSQLKMVDTKTKIYY